MRGVCRHLVLGLHFSAEPSGVIDPTVSAGCMSLFPRQSSSTLVLGPYSNHRNTREWASSPVN